MPLDKRSLVPYLSNSSCIHIFFVGRMGRLKELLMQINKYNIAKLLLFSILVGIVTVYSSKILAVEIKYAILRVDYDQKTPISRIDIPPNDLGFAGGELATADNLTTGQFLGQTYQLTSVATKPEAIFETMKDLVANGYLYVVLIAKEKEITEISNQYQNKVLLLNANAPDNSLRDNACQSNLLHISPSRAMLTDAISQFLMWKKWDQWVMIHGSHPEDELLAESFRNSANKFGATITEEKEFEDTDGARRTDTGHILVQKQIPVFLQGLDKHDVIISADESDVFAPYLPFQTWEPSIVAGSSGLRPMTWHSAQEAWGGTQLQRRFEALAKRPMQEVDYQVWLSLRIIGEAVVRTGNKDVEINRLYMLSSDFEIAAFKGTKLTFRTWNGQLRQPILLNDGRITVSVSPQEGYLHHRSPLDTLGLDEPESRCEAFN